jgi:hypothetical protein
MKQPRLVRLQLAVHVDGHRRVNVTVTKRPVFVFAVLLCVLPLLAAPSTAVVHIHLVRLASAEARPSTGGEGVHTIATAVDLSVIVLALALVNMLFTIP